MILNLPSLPRQLPRVHLPNFLIRSDSETDVEIGDRRDFTDSPMSMTTLGGDSESTMSYYPAEEILPRYQSQGPTVAVAVARSEDSMEAFMNEISTIRSYLVSLLNTYHTLSSLHILLLSPSSSPSSHSQLHSDLSLTRSTIQSLSGEIRARIAILERNLGADGGRGEERRTRELQIQGVKRRFRQVLEEGYEIERSQRGELREKVERGLREVKPNATKEEIEEFIKKAENGESSSDTGATVGDATPETLRFNRPSSGIFVQSMMHTSSSALRSTFSLAQSRALELRQIENEMVEVGMMINDLATLVQEQDEGVREIESAAMEVEGDLIKGIKQLDQAKIKARRRRKLRFICAAALLVFLLVLIIVIVVLAKR